MPISASSLRSNIFKLLDQVLDTGEPIEIKRKGRILKIIPDQPHDYFKNVKNAVW